MSDHGKEAMTDYSDEQIAALVERLRQAPHEWTRRPMGEMHNERLASADALASLRAKAAAWERVEQLDLRDEIWNDYDAAFIIEKIMACYDEKEGKTE